MEGGAPRRVVAAGHSAGGAFASRLASRIALTAPDMLAGLLLMAPVASHGFEANVDAVSGDGARPVLAVFSKPGRCNMDGYAEHAVSRAAGGFIGIRLPATSTHMDAEGGGGLLARLVCGEGWAIPGNVATLRDFTSRWAADMAAGKRTKGWYPGGETAERLARTGMVVLVEGKSLR